MDDVLNVAGHRLGTAEVESALVAHSKVAEAAVVGCPHDIKGQGIYAYVTLVVEAEATEELRKELRDWVRRKIAASEHDQLGDISTLAAPSVVTNLVEERMIR